MASATAAPLYTIVGHVLSPPRPAALVSSVVLALVLAGCGSSSRVASPVRARPAPTTPTAPPTAPTTTVPPHPTFASALTSSGPEWTTSAQDLSVSDTAVGLFLASGTTVIRTSPTTGTITANGTLPGAEDRLAAGGGFLWATVGGEPGQNTARLIRLDPTTLAVTGTWANVGPALTVTGATVWTAGSSLIGRSTSSGAVVHTVPLDAGIDSAAVSSDRAGSSVLVATDNDRGDADQRLIRVDADSGKVLASTTFGGVTSVGPTGPIDGTVWVTVSEAHTTVIERLNAEDLSADDPSPCVAGRTDPACTVTEDGGNAVSGGGTLWIEPGSQSPYECVDPVADKVLVKLPLQPVDLQQPQLIDVGDGYLFETVNSGSMLVVTASPVPAACRL